MSRRSLLALGLLLAVGLLARYWAETPDSAAIESHFADGRSDVWVEAEGLVDRILADDLEGDRHQRFIVQLASGHTVLLSHNIDLAPRIEDLQVSGLVGFRGEYEWNEQGGVVHWTHHDPGGRKAGGWIEYRGQRYH